MSNPFPLVTALIAVGCSAIMVAGGCSKDKAARSKEFFPVQDQMTPALEVQVARGARMDGTLYGHHFDGVILNSLGKEKLRLMAADGKALPTLWVYLDLRGVEPQADARRAAVLQHLVDAGVDASRLRIEMGPNPDTLHPANPKHATDLPQAAASGEAAVTPDHK